MKIVECAACGSKELVEDSGVVVCVYCQTKYLPERDDAPTRATVITVGSDIDALLQKCRDDPANIRQYVSLILDIDPTNVEAQKYLNLMRKKKKWWQ